MNTYGFTNIAQYQVSDWFLSRLSKDQRFHVPTDAEWLNNVSQIVREITEQDRAVFLQLSVVEFNACVIMNPLRLDDLGIQYTKNSNKRLMDISIEIQKQIYHPDDVNIQTYESPYRYLYDDLHNLSKEDLMRDCK
jgi:hypothetical protein